MTDLDLLRADIATDPDLGVVLRALTLLRLDSELSVAAGLPAIGAAEDQKHAA